MWSVDTIDILLCFQGHTRTFSAFLIRFTETSWLWETPFGWKHHKCAIITKESNMAPGKSEKIFVLEIEFRATQLEVLQWWLEPQGQVVVATIRLKKDKIFVLSHLACKQVQRTIILSAEEASPVDIHHGQSLIPLLVSFGYLSTNWNSKTPPSNWTGVRRLRVQLVYVN